MKKILCIYLLSFIFSFANDFDTALGYYNSENYSKAAPLLTFLCEDKASAKSCFLLGYMYENAQGLSKNDDLAMSYYDKACNAKLSNACFNLALLLDSKADTKNSSLNFYKACSLQHSNACKTLATFYERKKDGELALEFHKRACDLDDASSCLSMGLLYANGDLVRQDKAQAQRAYTKACDLKDAQACLVLADFYLNEKKDRSAAKRNFGISCDLGLADACKAYKDLLNDTNLSR